MVIELEHKLEPGDYGHPEVLQVLAYRKVAMS